MSSSPLSSIYGPSLHSQENDLLYDNFTSEIRFIDDTAFDLMSSANGMPLLSYDDIDSSHPSYLEELAGHQSVDVLFDNCLSLDSIDTIASMEDLFLEAQKTSVKVIQIQKRAIKAHNEIIQKHSLLYKKEMERMIKQSEIFDMYEIKSEHHRSMFKAELTRLLADCLLKMQEEVLEVIRQVIWNFVLADDAGSSNSGMNGSERLKRLHKATALVMERAFEAHPYPSHDEKSRLALYCGLSLRQVDHWFVNRQNRSEATDVFEVEL